MASGLRQGYYLSLATGPIVLHVLAELGAIAAGGAAVIAAFAAFRSARAAEATAKDAALAEKRRLLRQIVSSARGVVDESQAIEALAGVLTDLHTTYCVLTGSGIEGSARELFAAELAEGLSPLAPVKEHARRFTDDYPGLSAASEDDLSNTQARLAADVDRVRRIGDEMRWRRDDLSAKCAAEHEFRLRTR